MNSHLWQKAKVKKTVSDEARKVQRRVDSIDKVQRRLPNGEMCVFSKMTELLDEQEWL